MSWSEKQKLGKLPQLVGKNTQFILRIIAQYLFQMGIYPHKWVFLPIRHSLIGG